MRISYGQASNDEHLCQILALQQANLPKHISEEEAISQGFVTVEHDFSLLKRMNQPHAHIVAWDEDKVVAYALVMLRELEKDIPILVPMFEEINQTEYKGEWLKDVPYFVMGQVCVGKAYRGRGIFAALYEEMKRKMASHFPYVITEIDKRNARSIRAHEKVGFQTIKEYQTKDGRWWLLVLLELR